MIPGLRHMFYAHADAAGGGVAPAAVTPRPTEVDLLEKYRGNGIGTMVAVACSITDTFLQRAFNLTREGQFKLIVTTHEHNLGPIQMGWYLASGDMALAHMQNSGMPNAGDAYISMLGKKVYGIPAEVLVTWRGSNDRDDSEPHLAIGERMQRLALAVFSEDGAGGNIFGTKEGEDILAHIDRAHQVAREGGIGVVLLSPDAFTKTVPLELPPPRPYSRKRMRDAEERIYRTKGHPSNPIRHRRDITRDEAIREIAQLHPGALRLYSNGYLARAAAVVDGADLCFPNVGGMGTTLAMGWGAAMANPHIEVVVVDGDQNAQMSCFSQDHLPYSYPPNLVYYILDNGIGASVGTTQSLPLSAHHYRIGRVVRNKPDMPGSFQHPRVGKGHYDEAPGYRESGMQPLEWLTRRIRGAIQRLTLENWQP